MLTNKDVEKLKEVFVTKEEHKNSTEDLKNSIEEVKRHFDVVAEGIINSNKLVLEQFSTNTEKLADHEEKIETLTTDFSVLKSRVSAVEIKVKN